jgi:hypothetical protein
MLQARIDHEAAVNAARAETSSEYQLKIGVMAQDHAAQRAEAAEANSEAIAASERKHNAALKAAKDEASARLLAFEQRAAEESVRTLDAASSRHAAALADAATAASKHLEDCLEAERRRLASESVRELEAERERARVGLQSLRDRLASDHASDMSVAIANAIAMCQRDADSVLADRLAGQEVDHAEKMAATLTSHEAALASLRREHASEVSRSEATHRAELEAAVAAQVALGIELKDKAVAATIQELRASHAADVQRAQAASMAELKLVHATFDQKVFACICFFDYVSAFKFKSLPVVIAI